MNLFTEQIKNWQDWGEVFQSSSAFSRLIQYILDKEGLPQAALQNFTPGTNAVFKVGDYVIKVFAPVESGIDQSLDFQTELFATQRASAMGIAAPELITYGVMEDRYRFDYMITKYIEGTEFTAAVKTMSIKEKIETGHKLRDITDKINISCEPFNGIDVIHNEVRYRRWYQYPKRFQSERLAYIKSHKYDDRVFVHGDLCGDNIILAPDGRLFIIDFADAVLAPIVYEQALVAIELFELDPPLLYGYFGNWAEDKMMDICLSGLLIHDFGGDVIAAHIGDPNNFQCIDDLNAALKCKIEKAAS